MKEKEEITYVYVGDGVGIPGLPSPVTKTQAAAMAVSEILEAAIQNGSYIPQTPQKEGE